VLGIKHATEADHLAAVSTIVSQRRSIWQSAAVGVFWGIGHTAALVAAGVLVLGVGLVIPEKVANIFELVVALMIIFLGMRLLHLHIHSHSHGGPSHIHFHFQDEEHVATAHSGLAGWRSVIIGMIHGLAGSAGALTSRENWRRFDGPRLPFDFRRRISGGNARDEQLDQPSFCLRVAIFPAVIGCVASRDWNPQHQFWNRVRL
jgi:hypothetical protein